MNIKDIRWPIFYIPSTREVQDDFNVLYIRYDDIDYIIDNKNIVGDSLGARRLKIPDRLYKFTKTLFMFSELIEYTRNKVINDRKFIDSNGKIFMYVKNNYVPLLCRKILNVEYINKYVILTAQGIQDKFELPINYWNKFKYLDNLYLLLLKYNTYHILYDIILEKQEDSRRKV